MSNSESCFHCALPIPAGCDDVVSVDGKPMPVCCPGCKAVAELILSSGMRNYYEMRDAPEPGLGRPEQEDAQWQTFNRNDMLAAFAEQSDDSAVATLYVAGMYCSACSWLIESTLSKAAGVETAEINPVTHRVRIGFKPQTIGLGDVLATIAGLGYKPQPLAPESGARPELLEQRTALKRLLVASLGMMQVMMFAIALYAGEFQGIDAKMQRFLRLVSLLVTTPVVFYSARPFFSAALRGLRTRRPGMDLPVSIAIGAAYAASMYATLTNGPAVWFDSVVMFVFFLTLGRYLEMRARHRSIDRTIALTALLPNTATCIDAAGRREVPVSQLVAGERVAISPGDSVPADGTIVAGETHVDESLLSGESTPLHKFVGDRLAAGSIILDGALELEVRATGVDTTLGAISRISEQARYARPGFVRLTDRVASYFVVFVLVIASLVAIAWYLVDPSRVFVVTLSVLVVTCPCALALATPAAFAAAGSRLSELKLLLTNSNAIEAMSRATHAMFDKTGTLTMGRPIVTSVRILDEDASVDYYRQIAAALEAQSRHPIARAFVTIYTPFKASDCRNFTGLGISGVIDGVEWRLGKREFVAGGDEADSGSTTTVWLGNDEGPVAEFAIDDEVRGDALDTVLALQKLGLDISVVSGDHEQPVRRVADALGIKHVHHSRSPADKLALIQERQRGGETVIMIGDGINDAPVLAGADASIAPARAADLAQTHADVIMLGEALHPVVTAAGLSRQTMRIVRQNLAWAIVYNAFALPLAAAGMVPPWMAAIGMSASSLIVVLNALRLTRFS